MAKNRPERDELREDRIHTEIIVDANGPDEQVTGWCCYLDDIRLPISSPLRSGAPHFAAENR